MKGSQIGIIGGGIAAAVIIAVLFVSMGTQNDTAPLPASNDVVIPSEDKFLVYTTFYPLYQFTQGVAGDAADVRILIPSNGDPHSFELGPKTIVDLTKADMLIYNGVGFEPYIDEIMSSSDFDHIVFVDSSEGITLMEGEAHDHSSHGSNGDEKHDEHAEEFYEEIAHVIEEFEEGQITQSQSIEEIEDILHEHEGDEHGHEGTIEDIENLLHEIEDGHLEGTEGLEEIHHLVSGEDVHDDHAKEDGHDEHTEEDGHDEHNHGALDPHIWLNPVFAQLQVKNIANALSNSDPTNKNYYQSNAAIYNQELNLLDTKIRTELSGCKTDFITFHDAFSYFSEEYGLTQHTIISSTDSHGEVTPKTLENIISLARELNIKIIFAEESTSTKTSQVIADEIGGKVLVLSPLEIVSDETYVEKMTQNLQNLKDALC